MFKDELYSCIRSDNIESFNRILTKSDADTLMPQILEQLYHVALFGAVSVLDKLLTIPAIEDHFKTNSAARRVFLLTAMLNSGMPLITKIIETPFFNVDIIKEPYPYICELAKNYKCAPQAISKIQNITDDVDQIITLHNNQIWINAFVARNDLAMNCLLEFPNVFESVDLDSNHSEWHEYLNTYFMEYYFAKFTETNLSEKEARLGYLVLRNLIRTYQDRDAIRQDVVKNIERDAAHHYPNTFVYRTTKTVSDFIGNYISSKENVHAHRIEKLISIPAISLLAEFNNLPSWHTVKFAAEHILAESIRPKARYTLS